MASLLSGRNPAPLTQSEIRRASNTFLGLDSSVIVRYESNSFTRFRVVDGEHGEEYGEIIFSHDLYPGQNLASPNSCLSRRAAVAHELAHWYRWRDKRELNGRQLRNLDEALTSLEAAQMFAKHLAEIEVQQLVADAAERLRRHLQGLVAGE